MYKLNIKKLTKNLKPARPTGGLKIKNYLGGFTLIELMMAVVMTILISGSGMIYLNNFNRKQQFTALRNDVVNSIKLAQNTAKIRQVAAGYELGDLFYVELRVVGDYLVAGVNGVGTTYFAQKIADDMNVEIEGTSLYFWSGSGHLARNITGLMFDADETRQIRISAEGEISDYEIIEISALGNIRYLGLVTAYPTAVVTAGMTVVPPTVTPVNPTATSITSPISPTPTNPVLPPPIDITYTPTPSPTLILSSTPTLTPTLLLCRPNGMGCVGDADCCSNNCNLSICEEILPECIFPATNPHWVENPQDVCNQVNSCGYSDQFCL